jgi:hypothetical protein
VPEAPLQDRRVQRDEPPSVVRAFISIGTPPRKEGENQDHKPGHDSGYREEYRRSRIHIRNRILDGACEFAQAADEVRWQPGDPIEQPGPRRNHGARDERGQDQ